MLILLAALFLPHQTVKRYPQPDPACLYQWISDPSKLENRCEDALVMDVAYKNGRGTHTVLRKGDVLDIGTTPLRVFACTVGQGEPSASADHMVHPGYKASGYSCLTEQLEFPPYAGGK